MNDVMSQGKATSTVLMTVAVVIPCFRARTHVLEVIRTLPDFVDAIYVVDDACPEATGKYVRDECCDPRVMVLFNARNQGVGGAVLTGYRQAVAGGQEIVVKVDADGQMDPEVMVDLIAPIEERLADYTKGNRFYDLENISRMPRVRIVGNAILSFMAKLSTGYWDIFDPTNGYTAIHADALKRLPLDKVCHDYFFETDLLFRLNTIRAVVADVPMHARYGDEVSNLKIRRVIGVFMWKHLRNIGKRIFYNYFLRDFSVASLQLVIGVLLLLGGAMFGTIEWIQSARTGIPQPAGTVMLAALPIVLGLQLVLAFLGYDMASMPRTPLQRRGARFRR